MTQRPKVFISLNKAAAQLGVSPAWLLDQVNAGRVPHIDDGQELLVNLDDAARVLRQRAFEEMDDETQGDEPRELMK